MSHPALRLTPSNSPFFKGSTLRSPTKASRQEECGLRLSKVIGNTTTSSNGFDCLPSARTWTYVAGAAAVVATVDDDLKVTQRFFKARPSVGGLGRDANGQWPASPTPSEPRNRATGHVKDGFGASPLGASARDWSDSPTGRTLTAKDRVKAASSVALSANGKWLAVGETGYKPRILVFSLAEDAGDTPVTVLSEHTFGVHSLSFSPDSKYLASLGTVNDGFLYLWQMDHRTSNANLYASNKCTSLTNCMTWLGSSLVTAGLRHLKVWRPDEDAGVEIQRSDANLSPIPPRSRAENRSSEFGNSILGSKHRVLSGKNSLLGDMLETNFVSVVPLNDTEALVCAEGGEIFFLDDGGKAQSLTCTTAIGCAVSTAAQGNDGALLIATADGEVQRLSVAELRFVDGSASARPRVRAASPQKTFKLEQSAVVGLAVMGSITIALSLRDGIRLTNTANTTGTVEEGQVPAHGDAVNGVQQIQECVLHDASFLTFSSNGALRFWDSDCKPVASVNVPLDGSADSCGLANELKSVGMLAGGSLIAVGDKHGTLSLLDVKLDTVIAQSRAHSSEVTDICAFTRRGLQFLATSSRDRTVQLFAWQGQHLELLQTMDEHAGAVNQLLATTGGKQLVSCSADRTVVIREAMQQDEANSASTVFVMLRAINLKSAPTSMCLIPGSTNLLLAATDRSITKYSIESGRASLNFKCSDNENGEAAVMSKIVFAPSLNGTPAIVGISSSDKSVRLYTEFGTLSARDWGHTEGITDLAVLDSTSQQQSDQPVAARLVTVAVDSTIFVWDTSAATSGHARKSSIGQILPDGHTPNKFPSIGPPLRKVISYSELSRIKRGTSVDEGESDMPRASQVPPLRSSPQRLRKKTSRMVVAQGPRLEPAFRSNVDDPSSRRPSVGQRSPSPTSPRNRKDHRRRPSLGISMRPKSSENGTSPSASTAANATSAATGFGSLTGSTESVCRTLRAYRRKLTAATSNETIRPEALGELEKELKLTARVLSERSQSKSIDEAMMTKLLDQASEKIVGRLDERIKERVESEVRKSSEGSPLSEPHLHSPGEITEGGHPDALAGALQQMQLHEPELTHEAHEHGE
ncbi:hypothetical protein B0A50_01085 [Salinomyces thailandicus]|uniref:Uncharacterized protein n=1 Tax=Salinomyces thailandicus TaxID=706561 RepID=A0A4V5N879_9PEZI|nr:hypothetical protein B0A50_01085 [Salinomyces thailandica]